jgi:hypothetical protein
MLSEADPEAREDRGPGRGCYPAATCAFASVKVVHTLGQGHSHWEASGMRKRMTRIGESVAAYALAAALLVTGAAVLVGAVIRNVAVEPAR